MDKLNILEKYPGIRKVKDYIVSLQRSDGLFSGLKPSPIATMYGLGILYEFEYKPRYYAATKNWVKSLQTGKRGFAETTGQNSWDYTTYHGSEMHKYLDMRPRYEKEFINFVNSHQNKDGGFSKIGEKESNLTSTLFWAKSLLNLGYGIKDEGMLKKYLNDHLVFYKTINIQQVYHMLDILNKISAVNKPELLEFVTQNIKNNYNNLNRLYYLIEILKIFGKQTDKDLIKKIGTLSKDCKAKSIEEAFFLAKILNYFGVDFNRDDLANYVHSCELEQGGFYNANETNILSAYEALQSSRIIELKLKTEKLADWLKAQELSNGSFQNDCKITFWATRTMSLLNKNTHYQIINFLNRQLTKISPYNSFYLTYTCHMLGHLPQNYRNIITGLLRLQNLDGGFSLCPKGFSEMYETYRSCQTIKNITDLLNAKKIRHINWLSKVRTQIIKWVNSCESPEGGYSWIPEEQAYTQPTYQALHTLWILKEKARNIKNHQKFITNSQNLDGGFNGGEKNTPSMPLYTYYSLASLAMLESMKSKDNRDIAMFLGL